MSQPSDDPRTPQQKKVDAEIEEALRRGTLPRGTPTERRSSIERARRKKQAREEAARLGLGLGALRKGLGLSQREVARHLGTQRSAISRIESGTYGGLTIERFLLLLSTIRHLGLSAERSAFPETTEHPSSQNSWFYDQGVLSPESVSFR